MVVAVSELDLELDAAEERRGRMEDEAVGARLEVVGETRTAVAVGRGGCDGGAVAKELDRDARGGALVNAREEEIAREHRTQAARLWA